MSSLPTWDDREAKILLAIADAMERGEEPGRASRAAVPDLSDDLFHEAVAALHEGGFLHAQIQRLASGKVGVLFIERLAPRGLEAVGRWRNAARAVDLDQLIRTMSQVPEAQLETFFLAHGLGDAFASPEKGWGRQKKVNAALAEAERQGRRDELLEAAAERFAQARSAPVPTASLFTPPLVSNATVAEPSGNPDDDEKRRWVFLVQGRNRAATDAVTALLESADLRVLEWEQAVQETIKTTGSGSPYIGEILTVGMDRCHAVVVLFTPDDIGGLHPSLWDPDHQEPDEQQLAGRARQNVVFEAGMAIGRDASRTILVEFGRVAGFSDLAGRHAVRLDDSPERRKALLDRLQAVGSRVDLSGSRWMKAGDLDGALTTLEPYRLVRASDAGAPRLSVPPTISPLVSSIVTQWRPAGVPGSHATDLVIASVIQFPAGSGITHDPDGRLATRVRGEAREEHLARVLAESPVTKWLEDIAPSFHVELPLPRWIPSGYNTGEWSELVLEPPGAGSLPSLVSAQCKVNTGWIVQGNERVPGLVLFTELRLRLLELDAARRPDSVGHETTPAPAPAALSLDEVVNALVAALRMADTAVAMCADFTGTTATDGQAALWVTALGSAIDRVVDLTEFRLIPGSSSVGEHFIHVALPLTAGSRQLVDDAVARRAATQLLDELLERSGRRGTAERLAALAQPLRRGPNMQPRERRQ